MKYFEIPVYTLERGITENMANSKKLNHRLVEAMMALHGTGQSNKNTDMKKFTEGQKVTCINILPLPGNSIAPPLEHDKEYTVQEIVLDKKGNQHLHVGLISTVNFVTSYETKEELPDGDSKHWCHPSRFI